MKEEIAKNLIQKSTVNTSEDFTDKLMLKVEAEKVTSITPLSSYQLVHNPILAIIAGVVVFFIILSYGFIPRLVFFDYQVQINKIPFMILLSFLLILGLNHIWSLNNFVKNTQKN